MSVRHRDGVASRGPDDLIVEEPMEIRLDDHLVTTTMRTPGHDFELAAGYLFTEGIVAGRADVREVRYCVRTGVGVAATQDYNIVTVADADKKTPNLPWSKYLAANGLALDTFSLAQPGFFDEANKMVADVPVEQWQAYLRWNLVSFAAPYLSSAFVNEDFEFNGRALTGAKELRPRWKRVMDVTSNNLGEALGELYVARTFPPEAKAKGLALVQTPRDHRPGEVPPMAQRRA